MFTKAIVRTPAKSMINGITSVDMGKPNYELALVQHAKYVQALESCGLEVTTLPALEGFPDSCFVEDVALMTSECAILTRPGATSRRNEITHILESLESNYPTVYSIIPPGTLEAGDIMMAGTDFYIGLSDRTNHSGATQMKGFLDKHGMHAHFIRMSEMLHLKTGISYLENNNLLAFGEFLTKPEFEKFNILEVSEDESYAANSIWVNDKVLVPAGFPKTIAMVKAAGYEVLEIEASEFQKLDGGLSCLSLRF